MMHVVDFINEEDLFLAVPADEKMAFLKKMTQKLSAERDSLQASDLEKRLLEREKQSSTALGGGVAIPHTVSPDISEPLVSVIQVPEGIDFGSPDGKPVFLVFLVVFPERSTGLQLKILARIARICSYPDFVEHMKNAKDEKHFYQVLREEDAKHV